MAVRHESTTEKKNNNDIIKRHYKNPVELYSREFYLWQTQVISREYNVTRIWMKSLPLNSFDDRQLGRSYTFATHDSAEGNREGIGNRKRNKFNSQIPKSLLIPVEWLGRLLIACKWASCLLISVETSVPFRKFSAWKWVFSGNCCSCF